MTLLQNTTIKEVDPTMKLLLELDFYMSIIACFPISTMSVPCQNLSYMYISSGFKIANIRCNLHSLRIQCISLHVCNNIIIVIVIITNIF
jgi:hypothetical protein